jgi:hypothetical protein
MLRIKRGNYGSDISGNHSSQKRDPKDKSKHHPDEQDETFYDSKKNFHAMAPLIPPGILRGFQPVKITALKRDIVVHL